MARPLRSIALASFFLALLVMQGGAQQQQPPASDPAQQPPVFRTGINFVRVDVIISDKAGNPVSDLTAADFEVVEDNKPQKIETFKLVKLYAGLSDAVREPPRAIRTDPYHNTDTTLSATRLFP